MLNQNQYICPHHGERNVTTKSLPTYIILERVFYVQDIKHNFTLIPLLFYSGSF